MNKNLLNLIYRMMVTIILSACATLPAQVVPSTPNVGTVVTPIVSGPVSEITPESISDTPIGPGVDGQITITLDDTRKTVNLTVGQNFLLQLGDEYTWEINISDETVLSRAKNISVIQGAQGVYDALQSGTATLTAVGDPQCRQQQPPCGAPSILFEITIVVK